jgi:hypothetical protein
VHDDARLVVGGAAPVQPPRTLHWVERWRAPHALVAGGLHVIVGVEEERRQARVAEEIAVHAGMGAVALEQRHVFEAAALEQLGDGERAAPNFDRRERWRRDARNAHE